MEVFVARQPILTCCRTVFGYEVLFRSGRKNFFDGLDPDSCTMQVVNHSYFLMGLDRLAAGKRAFINFTRNSLLGDVALLFPQDALVVEVLESVEADREILDKCRELKQRGYLVALDDFTGQEEALALADLADIIKVDFLGTPPARRVEIVRRYTARGAKLLAEKVETLEEFEQALTAGFSYFQGYFFARPVLIASRGIPASKLNYLLLLSELNRPEVDFDHIERIVKREVSLSYKLLRYINSVGIGLKHPINSLKQALLLLGLRGVRQWASIVLVTDLAQDAPGEVIVNSATRAKLCEALADETGCNDHAPDLFLIGLLSLMDTIIGRPLEEILAGLPLAVECKQALLGGDNRLGLILRLVIAYERGEWQQLDALVARIGISPSRLFDLYLEALDWTAGLTQVAA